jgi:micrococcal nuclease
LTVSAWALLVGAGLAGACSDGGDPRCGPARGVVVSVLDGDTADLATGERIRYLSIDAPELGTDCYGDEARTTHVDLVEGREVELAYDEECTDRYDRLLAYVSVDGREINSLLVERGYACALYIPPNGADREAEFENLEAAALAAGRGMWGACLEVACAE